MLPNNTTANSNAVVVAAAIIHKDHEQSNQKVKHSLLSVAPYTDVTRLQIRIVTCVVRIVQVKVLLKFRSQMNVLSR